MIDYAVLCRAIEDWKSGHAPRATQSRPPPPRRAPAPQPAPAFEAADSAEEIQEQQAPEDRTIIYQLPDIVDEE